MIKRILNLVIVLTALLATGMAAHATPPAVPDSSVTSLLLAGVAAGLGLTRRFVR